MDIKTILKNSVGLTKDELRKKLRDELPQGYLVVKSNCEKCGDSGSYLIVEPDRICRAHNVVVIGDYEQPKPSDPVKCLICGSPYVHIMDLYNEIICRK